MTIKISRTGTLTGAYTPEVDTHALGGSGGVDTHAQLQENVGLSGQEVLFSTTTIPDNIASADQGSTETANLSEHIITPDGATNLGRICMSIVVHKITNAGTATARIKDGAGTLASTTSASIAINVTSKIVVLTDVVNVTAVAHTYGSTIQFNTTGGRTVFTSLFGTIVTLSGTAPTDTHALSGSLTPSVDTHAVSASGVIELGS